MTEPRARAARHKGHQNFEQELRQFLYAFGDDRDPLPETVRVLDEIVTDFIIETCHTAAKAAEITGRAKIKVDDFKFAIRNDEMATGRVRELLLLDKHLKDSRKQIDLMDGKVGLERGLGRGRRKAVPAADGKEVIPDGGEGQALGKGNVKVAEEDVADDMDIE